ncbi:rho guanine nucleotide exchange factor 11 isoform X3 [Dunckerocampus dactyliophorus]|uniref:rho guanine nucleotide exchange factor 11 isoform X3 n=1 Tax=Dunckerocampus dactyliophorus TaxID=161453 RepID=UPI002404BFAD|nr:rho guanine nucleotide exchange factor 11 isoform X3 [Dunckerocampus dactyliophorus]
MSLRQPTSTLDRLSSLTIGDSERKSSQVAQQREPQTDVPNESGGAGLVHRCVVVQKDQLGFGFTVCGERVKLVQNVRAGGAAVKAGVQEGDRIIKVNGSLVSSMTHQEVVKLIKSGTYVALTLQGPPPSATSLPLEPLPADLTPNQSTLPGGEAPPPAPSLSGLSGISSQRITGPKPLQDPEVQKHASQILRKMLEQEEMELQVLMQEQLRNPSSSLEERIESAKRRAQQVRIKLQQDVEGMRSKSVCSYITAGEAVRLSLDSNDGDGEALDSPHSSPLSSVRSLLSRQQSSDIPLPSDSSGKVQIIGPEEEDEEEDGYTFNEMDGPFQDIELLKSRPAHMTVFMRYVFTQLLDPNPLLFYLTVEAYLSSAPKDARSLAPQICSHFLDPDAPLKIKVPEEYLADIESRLHAQEDIRGPLSELQQQVLPDIQDQIVDYRSKQMMGLGALFGEGDLLLLDGDPLKERQVVDRQVTALWEILSKHVEDRSSPLASAVLLYLRHAGVKLRDSKVFPGLSTEKEKWLMFLKTKKLSGTKKEKDGEDKKRNPILKYIGKPRSTSQSTFHVPLSPAEVRPGSVRNIIQQFENHSETGPEDGNPQILSSSSRGDDGVDSPSVPVRLARSESLKAQGEGRRRGIASGSESVPRSRSDVDMEDPGEERELPGLRLLQHSASSSVSSSSARSLENPTPPFTPHSIRRSTESPLALLPDEEEACEGQNWQETVQAELIATLSPREVERQAVIYELFTTEASHMRTLTVLDQVFFQKMRVVLSSEELACIFPNLPQVYELHASLFEAMRKRRESLIVQDIGDVMLARFEGVAGDEFQEQVSQLCRQQSQALELIKNKQRKDPRFAHIVQECEASRHCRRLQLRDLLVSEMQRLTKYPLLLDNIIKHTEAASGDLSALQRAQVCCRGILQAVNEIIRETEHQQRLSQYQRRLDTAPLFKSLDLSTKKMIHEGPLVWKVGKDKQLDIQALLLSDCLLLLQRGPDERLQLRPPSRWLGGGGAGGDSKTSFSPLVKLDSLLVRSVATDNKALYVICATERQIYELVAGTASEKNIWKDLLEKAISAASSPLTNHSSAAMTSPSLGGMSPVAQSPAYAENAMSLQSDSQTCGEGGTVGVAQAALQDVETLRQLILFDLRDDALCHSSLDTPNERSSVSDSHGEVELHGGAQVVRKGNSHIFFFFSFFLMCTHSPHVYMHAHTYACARTHTRPPHTVALVAGSSSSVLNYVTDDVTMASEQSSLPSRPTAHGNIFYLVLPTQQGESATDDLEGSPPSEDLQQCHVIKNVEEIFSIMENLMSKLRQLKDIEKEHHKLLTSLREPAADHEEDQAFCSASVSRTASLERGSADGNEESPPQPKIQSTGF